MTKTKSSKLPLRTESIRSLTSQHLTNVGGGSFGTIISATSTAYTTGGPGTSSLVGGGTYTPSSKV